MSYLLYRIGIFVSLALPPKVSYRLADILGSLYYLLAKRDRRVVAGNIKVVLNQTDNSPELRRMSRLVFVNFARYLIEFFRASKIDLEYVEKNVTIQGRESLDKALKLGRGVLLLSAHLGNWELGAMVLSMLGYRVNVVAWTHKNRLVNNFFVQQRQGKGVGVIPLGTGIRRVFCALKNNESVAVLGDIDYTDPETGIAVKLFGRDTVMPKGPAALSLKTACPIVPVFMLRERGNKFKFVFKEPLIYKATKSKECDLISLTEKVAQAIESYIGLYPEQWFMLTARWQKPCAKTARGLNS